MVEIRFLRNVIDKRALIGPCSHVTSRWCQSVTPGMSPSSHYNAYSNWSLATYPFFSLSKAIDRRVIEHLLIINFSKSHIRIPIGSKALFVERGKLLPPKVHLSCWHFHLPRYSVKQRWVTLRGLCPKHYLPSGASYRVLFCLPIAIFADLSLATCNRVSRYIFLNRHAHDLHGSREIFGPVFSEKCSLHKDFNEIVRAFLAATVQ